MLIMASASAIALPPLVWAADFGQAQHVYVQPSLYERRIDSYSSATTSQSSQDSSGTSSFQAGVTRSTGGKLPYGVLPPPPMTGSGLVPPPPPYPATLSASAKELHSQVHKAISSPTVQAAYLQLKKQAEEYASSGKLNEAKHAVAEALKLSPHDKALLKELGTISVQRARQFKQSDDFDKATKFARQALAFDAGNSDANKVLDGLLQRVGINASDPSQRLKTADLLASQGNNDEAWVEYQAAARLKPSAEAYVGMGNIALRTGQKERAKAEYQMASQVDATSSLGYRQLGLLKYGQNDIVGANAALSKALAINSHDSDAGRALVELWQNQVSKVPGANSHLGLARAYQMAGDMQSAQTEYRTVVQIDPQNPHLPAARQSFKLALSKQEADQAAETAHTLESQGAMPEAYDKINEAVRLNPTDSDLHVYQGYLAEKLGRTADARNSYMTALKLNPHNLLAAARIRNLSAGLTPGSIMGAASMGVSGLGAPSLATPPPIAPGAPAPGSHEAALGNVSNFAANLRNHMLVQKTQMQNVENAEHHAMYRMARSPASESLATAPAVDGAAGAADSSLANSVAGTLANARSALSQASGGAQVPTIAQAMPALAPAIGSANNAVWQPPPPTMARSYAAAQGDAAAVALPYSAPTQSGDGEPPLAPPIAMPYQPTTAAFMTPSPVPSPMPPVTSSSAGMPNLRGSLPLDQSNVKLELLSASPKVKGVELSVILHNEGDQPLLLPRSVHGVIKYSGNRQDADVKVVFNTSAVAAHSSTPGTIHVPYDKADPTADLVLPGLLPAGNAIRDIHLTTSLAAR